MSAPFEPGDQLSKSEIICPHCGYSYQAEPCEGDADETPQEEGCGECGNGFIKWAEITITYRTKAKK